MAVFVQCLRRQFADPEIVGAHIVDLRMAQMLQQHGNRPRGFQKEFHEFIGQVFRRRNQDHCVALADDPAEIQFAAGAETVLIEFPVPLLPGFIDALGDCVEIAGGKIRPDHADPGPMPARTVPRSGNAAFPAAGRSLRRRTELSAPGLPCRVKSPAAASVRWPPAGFRRRQCIGQLADSRRRPVVLGFIQ